MKMLPIVFPILLLVFIGGRVQCGSPLETVSINVTQRCESYETECTFGCCPYAEATCCADEFECCQHGQTCIPIIGICIGAVNDNGQVSLTSEKSTRLRSSVLKCPPGTTECAPDRCCIYEPAVCCPDGEHCCPNGYRCDDRHKQCVRTASDNEIGRESYSVIGFEKPLRKMSTKSPYKSCPGGRRMCPGYMSCCIHDNGNWGCCPNPSLPEIKYGGGECCDTIFGHMCCPDDYPICTAFGCTKKMFLIAFSLFILCSVRGGVDCTSLIKTVSRNVTLSCQPYETQCAFGCCPYAQATCCADGFECCQHGQTCIPIIGICIGAVNDNGQVSLTSEKSTRLRSSIQECPPGTTECGLDMCCPFEQGVCCEDGEHCCPNSYRCDVPHQQCIREITNNEFGRTFYPLRKISKKSPYKSCPGGRQMCPGYMSCCMKDNGDWGCCPNPSLPEIRYGGGECCNTIFGHMCCPDDYPTCTIFGCTK